MVGASMWRKEVANPNFEPEEQIQLLDLAYAVKFGTEGGTILLRL